MRLRRIIHIVPFLLSEMPSRSGGFGGRKSLLLNAKRTYSSIFVSIIFLRSQKIRHKLLASPKMNDSRRLGFTPTFVSIGQN